MDLITFATLVAAGAAVIGLAFQQRQLAQSQREFIHSLKADHKQRRREAALHLWDDWHSILDSEKRSAILSFLKWAEIENDKDQKSQWISFIALGGRVSREQFSKAVMPDLMKGIFIGDGRDRLSIKELENIRTALIALLDLMEKVAVAYHYHIADREMLNAAFKDNIVKFAAELKDIIIEFRKHNAHTTWKVLTDLVFNGDWKSGEKYESHKPPDEIMDSDSR